jgi:hypothetical protein
MLTITTANEVITGVKKIEVLWYSGVSFLNIIFEDGEKPTKSMPIQLIKTIE